MDSLINSSLDLDYDIFYAINLNKQFSEDYKSIFNYNLDSFDTLKDNFDFKNFSFENFFHLLKLFDICDSQRKNFRTLTIKFLKERLSIDNIIKEDENLILNKLKIHNELKERIIDNQQNKLNKFNLENEHLKKELEKIKKEYYNVKYNLNNKANSINNKKINVNNNNPNNYINNNLNNINSKSKILKKTKTPTKINKAIGKINNISNLNSDINNEISNDLTIYKNNIDLDCSNANSITSRNSQVNKLDILNTTFKASKASFNNIDKSNNNKNTNNKITMVNQKMNNNNSTINNQILANNSTNKKNEIKLNLNSNKLKDMNNNYLDNNSNNISNIIKTKIVDINNVPLIPSNKINNDIENIKNQINPNNCNTMNITMKVNNINNFNSNINANIISNSSHSVKKDLIQSSLDFKNLNNTNFLNDSLNTNENLLKKMMNLDFLGDECNMISNSPINSPRLKYTTIQTEEESKNNQIKSNNINEPKNYLVNNNYCSASKKSDTEVNYENNPNLTSNSNNKSYVYNNSVNSNNSKIFKNAYFNNNDNSEQSSKNAKNLFVEQSKEFNYNNNNINVIDNSNNNYQEHSLFGRDCFNNSIYSHRDNYNHFNNQKSLRNLNNIEIPYDKMIADKNDISIKNNNNNESLEKNKRIVLDASIDSENKNSPCFMREINLIQNPNINSNLYDYNPTFNNYYSNTKENKNKIEFFEDNTNLKNNRKNNNVSYDNNKRNNNNFSYNEENSCDEIIEEAVYEKVKEMENTKLERFSSIPRKKNLTNQFLQGKCNENQQENLGNLTSRNNNKDIENKRLININVKQKKNFDDLELSNNKKSNININSKYKTKLNSNKNSSPKKTNNPNNLIINQKQNKNISENSPKKYKKGHSNSIEFQQQPKLNNQNSELINQNYQSNFGTYNTSIKKRNKLKQHSENYDSEILMTDSSWAKPRLDISDVFYNNNLNKTDLNDYVCDMDKFHLNTTRDLSNPKKLIFVEKLQENKNREVSNSKSKKVKFSDNNINNLNNDGNNYNLNSSLPNKNDIINNSNNLANIVNKKLNLYKLNSFNHNNTRNAGLINHCSINSNNNDDENIIKHNTCNLKGGLSPILSSRNMKEETKIKKKPLNINNNSITLYNQNFKESKLAMDLINKSSTPRHQINNNNVINFNGLTNNLKSNATINNLNNFKKKMNL